MLDLINDAAYQAFISSPSAPSQTHALVMHTATWCGPCQMIGPVFHDLSDRMDNVVFVKVDVDEIPDTAAKYSVSAMPTFVFIRSGEVVDRLMGANPAALEEKLQSLA